MVSAGGHIERFGTPPPFGINFAHVATNQIVSIDKRIATLEVALKSSTNPQEVASFRQEIQELRDHRMSLMIKPVAGSKLGFIIAVTCNLISVYSQTQEEDRKESTINPNQAQGIR